MPAPLDAPTFNRAVAAAQYQYVDVTFNATAGADTEIQHTLQVANPEDIDYILVRSSQVHQVYHDSSATRRVWTAGTIYLRSTAASAKCTLLLTVRNNGEAPSTLAYNGTVPTGVTLPNITAGTVTATTSMTTPALTVTGTGASAIDVAGGINAGSGNVGIVDTSGKIPAISTTYFASVSGANLTSIPDSALTSNVQLQDGEVILTARINPAQITSNQNNYNPSGLSTTFCVVINSDAARDITGLVAQADGTILCILNSGSFNITLKHASGSSSAANQFLLAGSVDYVITPNSSILVTYFINRWRPIG